MSAPATTPRDRGSLRRGVGFATLGALLWGSWALFVNVHAGARVAARAALAQAAMSFAATLGLSLVLERLFRVGRTPWQGFWIATVGTIAISVGAMTTVHAIAGTPRILATVGPSNALGATFFTLYAWGLRSAAARAPARPEA